MNEWESERVRRCKSEWMREKVREGVRVNEWVNEYQEKGRKRNLKTSDY